MKTQRNHWNLLHSWWWFKIQTVLLLLSHVHISATPRTAACQAPLSMGFPRQEYCSGLPFPSPEDLPNPGIKPTSSALQSYSLLLSHWGSTLEDAMLSETGQSQEDSHTVWFHLCEVPREVAFTEAGSRTLVGKGWGGKREWELAV